ncbi:hypothetical protein SUGI_0244060 [Cryptomeria japonica]|nr:hypothetical protein SUGI_0244060 [Cryptomeria japonica]
MGNCTSMSSSQTQFMQTAKVIFFNGVMKEFSEPIKAGEIIEQNPGYFLCHWDSLYIDRSMVSVNSKEELELGELYFLLPLSKLQYVLSASDMAAMVFKANSASKQIISSKERDNMYCKILPYPLPQEKADCDEERWEIMSCKSGGSEEMCFSRNVSRVRLETILEGNIS